MAGLAILAGGGRLPILIAESLRSRGEAVHIVAIRGEADAAIADYPHTWVGWAQLGRTLRTIRTYGDGRVVIAGGVSRPNLASLRPDFGLIRHAPAIARILAAGGDNAVLTRVIAFFEAQGICVLGVQDVAPDLVAITTPSGLQTAVNNDADCALAFDILARLSDLDVGQGIVVSAGRILAIEGVDGTDRMLARLAQSFGGLGQGSDGVLVKAPKTGQELRIDMPTIGPKTITGVAAAGLTGVTVAAGHALILERADVVRRANEHHIALKVFPMPAALISETTPRIALNIRQLGRITPTPADLTDVATGLDIIIRLAAFKTGAATAVVRRHVLAVAANETSENFTGRVAGLRQWGMQRLTTAWGALSVRLETDDDAAALVRLFPLVTAARMAGVAFIDVRRHTRSLPSDVIRTVDTAGLFLVEARHR
jgi:DUF1009 family protein